VTSTLPDSLFHVFSWKRREPVPILLDDISKI
jgi:hypothetical protein